MGEVKLLAEWFWTDRWMGSRGFLLAMEPRGLYREMLTQAWRRGARLPNDHEEIRRAVGCTPAEWRRSWPKIEQHWRVEGDYLVNDTQLEVYAEALGVQQRAHERGVKGAQARAQARAQAQRDQSLKIQPPSPSPSPTDLPERSPGDPRPRAASSSGVMAGSLPRDHIRHAWCSERICVPDFIHARLERQRGGDASEVDGWLRGWYERVVARWTGKAIGEPPEKFWPREFSAEFPAPAVPKAGEKATGAAYKPYVRLGDRVEAKP